MKLKCQVQIIFVHSENNFYVAVIVRKLLYYYLKDLVTFECKISF